MGSAIRTGKQAAEAATDAEEAMELELQAQAEATRRGDPSVMPACACPGLAPGSNRGVSIAATLS